MSFDDDDIEQFDTLRLGSAGDRLRDRVVGAMCEARGEAPNWMKCFKSSLYWSGLRVAKTMWTMYSRTFSST